MSRRLAQRSLRTERTARVLFAAAVVVLGVRGLVALAAIRSAMSEARWIDHTLMIEKRLALASSDIWEFEASRGPPVADRGDPTSRVEAARIAIDGLLKEVDGLTRDNGSQERRLVDLRRALSQVVTLGPGDRQSSERSHALIKEMQGEEERLLAERRVLSAAETRRATVLAAVLTVLTLLMMIAAGVTMIKGARDLRAAFEALNRSEGNLAATLNSIGDGVIATDVAGQVTWMNPVSELLTGWTGGSAVGHPLAEVFRIVDGATRVPSANPIDRILREGFITGMAPHTVLVSKDGTNRRIADSGAPIRDPAGTVLGVVLVYRDMTKDLEAKGALRQSEERFSRLSESGVVGIVVADVQGNVTEANEAYLRMLCYTREDLLHDRLGWADLTPPEWREADERAMELLKTQGVAPPWEKEMIRKDGSRLPILIGLARLDPPNCMAFVVDLTDRKKAEHALARSQDQVRQAQKMDAVGALAGGIAHDFNNMLSVILAYSEMSILALSPGEPLREDLEEIRNAASRAAVLTRQLLVFSREQVLETSVVDLNELTGNLVKMLDRLIGEDVVLTVRAGPALGSVRVDSGQMEQVLVNLVVNARDAMPTGGQLIVETANVELGEDYVREHLGVAPGAYVMLAVTDTGTGMTRAIQDRIFEPFFTTKAPGKGTGLGLATVFGIVKQSEGHVWASSEVGVGTTFYVYLPRTDEAVVSVEVEREELTKLGGTETLLVVEDDGQVRIAICGFLRAFGYHVLEARNAGEALLVAEMHSGRIHLMLTDAIMPFMSGFDLAKRLGSIRPGMGVLCMSGYTDEALVKHGIVNAGLAFIQKPITPHKLGVKIREVLATHLWAAEEW
jgi:PAS domain S-box-containing protein